MTAKQDKDSRKSRKDSEKEKSGKNMNVPKHNQLGWSQSGRDTGTVKQREEALTVPLNAVNVKSTSAR